MMSRKMDHIFLNYEYAKWNFRILRELKYFCSINVSRFNQSKRRTKTSDSSMTSFLRP